MQEQRETGDWMQTSRTFYTRQRAIAPKCFRWEPKTELTTLAERSPCNGWWLVGWLVVRCPCVCLSGFLMPFMSERCAPRLHKIRIPYENVLVAPSSGRFHISITRLVGTRRTLPSFRSVCLIQRAKQKIHLAKRYTLTHTHSGTACPNARVHFTLHAAGATSYVCVCHDYLIPAPVMGSILHYRKIFLSNQMEFHWCSKNHLLDFTFNSATRFLLCFITCSCSMCLCSVLTALCAVCVYIFFVL